MGTLKQVALWLLVLAMAPALKAQEETSLERWGSADIRRESEAVEARWQSLTARPGLRDEAPLAFSRASDAVVLATGARRSDDERERVYRNYQAQRAMDLLQEKLLISALEAETAKLSLRRAVLDEERTALESERRAKMALAREEAQQRRQDAELARREQELAEREALEARVRAAEAENVAVKTRIEANAAVAEADRAATQSRLQAAESEQAAALAAQEAAQAKARAATLEASLHAAMTDLEFERTKRGPMLVLGDVLFEVNGADLKEGARSRLNELYAFLADNPEIVAMVEGHTDTTGSAEYNMGLSNRRAEAVRSYLVSLGLKPEQVTAKGFGMTQPMATNDTQAGRQQNRRVEIIFTSS